jgi:multifunctional beta-oxidation protein
LLFSLGASYARLFAKLGASVVVNDSNKVNADAVVTEINNSGGRAISNYDSVVDSASAVIDTAIRNYGRIDVLVNNAGFLLDQTFLKMTEDKWDAVLSVHLQGTYAMTKAAWPYFTRKRYGRIINTSSTSGIYGFFGQANYSAAKLGIFGLTQALSRSGAAHNIYAYAIAPVAGSQAAMNRGWALSPSLKAAYNAPLVVLLGSDKAPASNSDFIFEQGAGWIGATRQRGFAVSSIMPEAIHGHVDKVERTYASGGANRVGRC